MSILLVATYKQYRRLLVHVLDKSLYSMHTVSCDMPRTKARSRWTECHSGQLPASPYRTGPPLYQFFREVVQYLVAAGSPYYSISLTILLPLRTLRIGLPQLDHHAYSIYCHGQLSHAVQESFEELPCSCPCSLKLTRVSPQQVRYPGCEPYVQREQFDPKGQTEYVLLHGLSSLARLHEHGWMQCRSCDMQFGHCYDTVLCLPEGLMCH